MQPEKPGKLKNKFPAMKSPRKKKINENVLENPGNGQNNTAAKVLPNLLQLACLKEQYYLLKSQNYIQVFAV